MAHDCDLFVDRRREEYNDFNKYIRPIIIIIIIIIIITIVVVVVIVIYSAFAERFKRVVGRYCENGP